MSAVTEGQVGGGTSEFRHINVALFWVNFGWNGVAAMIALLTLAAFGVAALLLRMPVNE